HALDHRFGRERWKVNPEVQFDVVAAPTVAGKTLLIGTVQGMIYGIDTESGQIKWSYKVVPSSTSDSLIAEHANIAAPPVVANKTTKSWGFTVDNSLVKVSPSLKKKDQAGLGQGGPGKFGNSGGPGGQGRSGGGNRGGRGGGGRGNRGGGGGGGA